MRSSKKILFGVALGILVFSFLPIQAEAAPFSQEECLRQNPGNVAECQQLQTQYNTAQQTQANPYSTPSASTEMECKSGITECLAVIMYYIGPLIASKVAYVGAYFFSIVVQLSLNSTAYALGFLSDGWTTVRDLANMSFIFILVYIAMTVMLQAETSGTIKTLAIVVVIALLVNFSFFFTRVVIDMGNILALQFYNAIPAGVGADGKIVQINGVKDLSTSIMGAVGPQVLLSKETFDKLGGNGGVFSGGAWAALGTFTVIYLSVAAMLWMLFFTFIQVGIKFMLRIVGLWFLLIASPLAFVAKTMKKTEGYFDQWLKKLVEFSLYPAIFLFMFLILTRFAGTLLTGNTTGNGNLLNAIANTASSGTDEIATVGLIASVFIRMGFIIALMFVALKVSDWVVKEGSGIASKVTGNLTGKSFGLAGFAGRNTLGLGAYSLGQSKFMQNLGSKGVVGRNLLSGVNRIGKATFDGRNSKTINKSLGLVGGSVDVHGKVTPLEFGKATNKGGYKGDFDARVKALQKEAEQFKAPSKDEKAKAETAAKAEFEQKYSSERTTIKTQVKTAADTHQVSTKRAAQLETDLGNAQNDIQRSNIAGLIDTHKITQEIAKEALDAAKKREVEFDKKEKEEVAATTTKLAPNYKEQFAKHITSNEGNLFRTLSLWVPKAEKTAAEKIRKGKSKSDELIEKIKEMNEDDHGDAEKKEEKKDEPKKDDNH